MKDTADVIALYPASPDDPWPPPRMPLATLACVLSRILERIIVYGLAGAETLRLLGL